MELLLSAVWRKVGIKLALSFLPMMWRQSPSSSVVQTYLGISIYWRRLILPRYPQLWSQHWKCNLARSSTPSMESLSESQKWECPNPSWPERSTTAIPRIRISTWKEKLRIQTTLTFGGATLAPVKRHSNSNNFTKYCEHWCGSWKCRLCIATREGANNILRGEDN